MLKLMVITSDCCHIASYHRSLSHEAASAFRKISVSLTVYTLIKSPTRQLLKNEQESMHQFLFYSECSVACCWLLFIQ